MAGINDLPIELYELIFRDYLSITDLFNCRLVNKKFKFATYESVQKLVIGDLKEFRFAYHFFRENGSEERINDYYWFHNNELINHDHIISFKCFVRIRSKSIFNLYKNLKYLRINFYSEYYRKLKEQKEEFLYESEFINLNSLINLESLEIYCGFNSFNYCKLNLNLENLKYLRFDFQSICQSLSRSCELNTPKLEKFEFDQCDLNKIKIKSNPESIKHLISSCYSNHFKIFKNLEIIELGSAYKDGNLLSYFNNLKQLKFQREPHNPRLNNGFIKILKKSKELIRDIDIYINGVKIINEEKVMESDSSGEDILKFQLDNYDLLDSKISIITQLNYSKLNNYYDNLRNDLPSSFFDKYQYISKITILKGRLDSSIEDIAKKVSEYVIKSQKASGVVPSISPENKENKSIDADDLSWFLNNLKCLKRIGIDSVLLDQNFFNNLPNTIRVLIIKDKNESKSIYLNIKFDFILKLTKLIQFYQKGWNIDLFDLAFKSFENSKYLKTFEFYNKKFFEIRRIVGKGNNRSCFKVYANNHLSNSDRLGLLETA